LLQNKFTGKQLPEGEYGIVYQIKIVFEHVSPFMVQFREVCAIKVCRWHNTIFLRSNDDPRVLIKSIDFYWQVRQLSPFVHLPAPPSIQKPNLLLTNAVVT
jgi:hypothetical protein